MTPLGTDSPGGVGTGDLRLVTPAVGTWLCAAALLGAGAPVAFVVALALIALAAALAPVLRRPRAERWGVPVLAVLVCAAAGALAVGGRLAGVDSSPLAQLAEREARATAGVVVTGDPRPRPGPRRPGRAEYAIDARTVWVRGSDGIRVRSRVPVVLLSSGAQWRGLLPGHRVRLSGRVVPAGEGDLVRGLVLVRGPPHRVDPPAWPQVWAGEARSRLRDAASVLPTPASGLLPAVVVGDVSGVDHTTAEAFRDTGMTHLLTVSGANLAVLTGVALGLGRWFSWPPWLTASVGAAMIVVFVLVARAEPSVLRSAVMGGIALLALAVGRRRTGLAALSAAVIGLVLFSPDLARSYGFALSVLATGGIMILAPRWRDHWSAWLPGWLAETVAVALAAHLACAPVLVLLSAEVSWVAVPANALAGPVMPVATVGGFVVAGLALLSPWVASVLVWVPGVVVAWVGAVATTAARVPQGAFPWRGDLVGTVALGVLAVSVVALGGWPRRVLLALAATVATTTLAMNCAAPAWPPRGWAVVACDVGQGDTIALAHGAHGAIVVDTGPDPVAANRCLTDLGVRQVVLLVLTHGDSDHTGGVSGVLTGRRVSAALAPEAFGSPTIARRLARARVPVRTASAGQHWKAGPWRLDVLWPRGGRAESDNDVSVVLRARWAGEPGSATRPLSVLLTGDIEEGTQRALLGTPAIRDVDVLKTPHHGSRTQDDSFLTATRPRVALTSAGRDNPYGHPAPPTWRRLESLTRANYRTDRHGDIAVLPGEDSPSVVSRGPSPDRR